MYLAAKDESGGLYQRRLVSTQTRCDEARQNVWKRPCTLRRDL